MKITSKILIGFVLITLLVISGQYFYSQYRFPKFNEKWARCQVDSDCSSGIIGCYHWEPIHKKHMSKLARVSANQLCFASVPAGPQPVSACVNGRCVLTDHFIDVTTNKVQ